MSITLNADFNSRASVHGQQKVWEPSPVPGVQRKMLHRIGDEVAQATSFVRYEPSSQFSPHTHVGGEEFIVLDGVFQDEHGDYPALTYVRNPPMSSHTPKSSLGAIIFVKLWQFDSDDRTHVRVAYDSVSRIADAKRPGVVVSHLFKDAHEDVRIEVWSPNTRIELDLPEGAEFLVIDGLFNEGGESFQPYSWLRLPPGSRLVAATLAQGAKVWIKLGHVRHLSSLRLP
jgi:anti-sigma factor ChrR (cupin superfamily)